MQRTYFRPSLIASTVALLLAASAQAAELGDIVVRSSVGQPLSADIELVQLAPDEVSSLQVRLAQPDVFRGANITMHPALATVRMAVTRRDGRQFLHLSTSRSIDAEYVHVFLELSAGGRQEVRTATIWLPADTSATLPTMPAMAAAPAPAMPVQAGQGGASLPDPAVPVTPLRERGRPAPLPSAHESEVGHAGELRAAAAVNARRPQMKPAPTPVPAPVEADPTSVTAAALPVTQRPSLLAKRLQRLAAPACTPSGMTGSECAALDQHSVELSGKLTELEGKVKLLQGALAAKPGAAVAPAAQAAASASASDAASVPASVSASASAAASASASVPASASAAASASASVPASASAAASASAKPVRVLPKLKYKKEKPPEPPASNMPWIAAGAGLLTLLLALGGYLYLRKKRGSSPLKIWQGFRKKKAAATAEPAAPSPEVTPESLMERSSA